jgi:rhodanese-related sulfurtransferase
MSSISIVDLPRISRETLASIIRKNPAEVTVIDVRDSDYIGGHIVNGINVPTHTHDYRMPELVRTLKDQETVVFHCALSQQRGPSSALRYLREKERVEAATVGRDGGEGKEGKVVKEGGEKVDAGVTKDGEGVVKNGQKVYVLEGGFVKWQEV